MKRSCVAGGSALALALCFLRAGIAAADEGAVPSTAGAAFDPLARGRTLTRWFFAGQLDSLRVCFNAQMSGLMTPQQLHIFHDQVQGQVGQPAGSQKETVEAQDSVQVYTRRGKYTKAPEQDIDVVWMLDPQARVAGFFVRPTPQPMPSRFLEYQTKTTLHLPFDGEWYVFWGGRTVDENQHATSMDQRFALDVVIRKDGKNFTGDGKSNARYNCWGAVIRAPSAGTVVAMVDNVDDNRPGELNEKQPLGNHVILDHGNGEFSFLCHLQRRSVVVKMGQTVQPGDTLGVCGNSGRSSEPHLHYHLQNSAKPLAGEGLPAFFSDYRVDGQTVARGEPKRGQTIAPGATASARPPGAGTKKKRDADKSKATAMGDAPRWGDAP